VVASIEETAERYSIPKAFIGLILLPIVVSISCFDRIHGTYARQANAAEHVTSIWMAMKGQMEVRVTALTLSWLDLTSTQLTIGICVGSSIVSCVVTSSRSLRLTRI
jgi:Ca2+:H+ antiporter